MATVHVLKVKCLNPVDSVAKPVSGHHSNLTCWREYGLGMRRASILTLSGNEARMRLVRTNTYTKRWWWCHLAQCNVESRKIGEGKGNIATVLLCCLGRHCPGGPFPFFFFSFFFFLKLTALHASGKKTVTWMWVDKPGCFVSLQLLTWCGSIATIGQVWNRK